MMMQFCVAFNCMCVSFQKKYITLSLSEGEGRLRKAMIMILICYKTLKWRLLGC